MKLRSLLLLCSLLAGLVAVAPAAEDVRFSKTVAPAESTAAGLDKLSSDQVAILDALVRRDVDASLHPNLKHPRAALFSQRLSADERTNAGFNLLSSAEIAHLDAQVSRVETYDEPATAALASPGAALVNTPDYKAPLEIHGSVSLFYGTGSHGYSTRGGSIDLYYQDPDHDYTIAVGYSEIYSKGGLFRHGRRGAYFPNEFLGATPPAPQ